MPLPALAAVAAIAAAAHLSRKRGSLAMVPPGYEVSPVFFWSQKLRRDVEAMFSAREMEDELGLFHVTTARSKVLAGRLKSRAQLRAQVGDAGRSYGLGGGEAHQHLVSVSVTKSGAQKIYKGLKTVILASQGKLTESEAALAVLGWTGFPRSVRPQDPRDRDNVAPVFQQLWSVLTGAEEDDEEDGGDEAGRDPRAIDLSPWDWSYIARNIPSSGEPELVFNLISVMEHLIHEMALASGIESCTPAIIMLEPFHKMARMSAEELSILRLAAREGSTAFSVESECELRFSPKDLIVLEEIAP